MRAAIHTLDAALASWRTGMGSPEATAALAAAAASLLDAYRWTSTVEYRRPPHRALAIQSQTCGDPLPDDIAATVRADHNGVWPRKLELFSTFITNRRVEREGSCCTDCLMVLVNDDSTGIEDLAAWRAGVERLDPTDRGRLQAVPAGNSSSWFGTTDCHYCGSALHGDRHAIAFLT